MKFNRKPLCIKNKYNEKQKHGELPGLPSVIFNSRTGAGSVNKKQFFIIRINQNPVREEDSNAMDFYYWSTLIERLDYKFLGIYFNSLEMFCCRSQPKICVIISLETIFEWRPNLGSILMLEPNEAGSE